MASQRNGTLYIGVTNNLIKRIYEHRNNVIDGFTKKYKVHLLVHYEQVGDINSAIAREKILKKWRRQEKMDLIETFNPDWLDLYEDIVAGLPLSRE